MMARWLDVAGSFWNNLQNKLASYIPVAKTRLFQTLDGLSQLTRPFKENTCYEVMCFKQVLDLLPSLRTGDLRYHIRGMHLHHFLHNNQERREREDIAEQWISPRA